jgi:chemotaxis protein methyltransferase CheR
MTLPTTPGALAPPLAGDPVPLLLRDLVHDRLGIHFEDGRLDLMLEKLEPRAQLHACRSFLDYYYILKYDDKGPEEWRRVMDCFSVQETFFWREHDQIQALVDVVVPAWFRGGDRPLRIWSAACATGEEPYSLAIALTEAGWGAHPIELIASDASEGALEKARAGLYRERSFRALPADLRRRYFQPRGEGFALDPQIISRVDFRWANLKSLPAGPDLPEMQVIFCRNVFIYFSAQAISQVAGALAERIAPDGYLFIGASESLVKLSSAFELSQLGSAFVYRPRRLP